MLAHPLATQRVDKIFRNMDRDKDARLTYDEFVEGSKQDPTIVQVRHLRTYARLLFTNILGVIIVRRVSIAHKVCCSLILHM